MDLRLYYQKIREVEATIAEEFPIVVSSDSPDGGKPGTRTEVPRRLAAKMIVEGLAQLASNEQAKAYKAEIAEAKRTAEKIAQSSKLQVTVLSTDDLDRLRGAGRAKG